jgi:hypothetical protein
VAEEIEIDALSVAESQREGSASIQNEISRGSSKPFPDLTLAFGQNTEIWLQTFHELNS